MPLSMSMWSRLVSIDREVVIGWDIGGAHLKAVSLASSGDIIRCIQLPCPLWQGLHHLESAVEQITAGSSATHHAITMTGELVDLFAHRREGVIAIANAMARKLENKHMNFFAGEHGFVSAQACKNNIENIASMNWYATGLFAATKTAQALVIDIGSTTTDMMIVRDGKVDTQGKNDFSRMAFDELVYTGLVRTPLMALTQKVFFQATEVGVMAEYFATTADVYRVLGELPEEADQQPAADNGDKTPQASTRRLARMIGCDVESAAQAEWENLAQQFADKQLQQLQTACERQLARGLLVSSAPIIGAGCGNFLVKKMAQILRRPYLEFSSFVNKKVEYNQIVNVCAPAYSVAALALAEIQQRKIPHA
jgi:(4-(4-[2-(gamma-L-glutamylamino)ethyl]phenoxymethyl)furan-2-yl)methanamine synthase